MRVARTFKDFILVAAAVFLVTPLNALMASQRQDTPATTRDCPYRVQSVPLQATRCPYYTSDLTSDLEPALVLVEPARAEAGALERERPRRVSLSTARLQWRDALICVTTRAGWPPRMSWQSASRCASGSLSKSCCKAVHSAG
jgi:hypothetical protein